MARVPRVAIVHRQGVPPGVSGLGPTALGPVAEALEGRGLEVVALRWHDAGADAAQAVLEGVDGVLVWVDPVAEGEDRRALDGALEDAVARGAFVSARPDAASAIGTKDVLWRTRELGWPGDVHRYTSADELVAGLPRRLAESGPRVLKQRQGSGGTGVWKVSLLAGPAGPAGEPARSARVALQHARVAGDPVEVTTLGELLDRLAWHLEEDGGAGAFIDQAFQPRVAEGLVHAYFVRDRLCGFARQYPAGHPEGGVPGPAPTPGRSFVVSSPPAMVPLDDAALALLRAMLDGPWLSALLSSTGIGPDRLPVLWEAEFLLGPRGPGGQDTYVLCEVNVASVVPYPDVAPALVAEAVAGAVGSRSPGGAGG